MKVKEAIRILKTMPQNQHIYWQDFDCDDFGMSASLNRIELKNFDNLTEFEQTQNEFKLTGDVVVMHG